MKQSLDYVLYYLQCHMSLCHPTLNSRSVWLVVMFKVTFRVSCLASSTTSKTGRVYNLRKEIAQLRELHSVPLSVQQLSQTHQVLHMEILTLVYLTVMH